MQDMSDAPAGGEPEPASSATRRRRLPGLVVALLLLLPAVAGYWVGNDRTRGSGSSDAALTGGSPTPVTVPPGSRFDLDAVVDAVDDVVVNITTSAGGGRAAGTGIVISADGLVLTNNHVIAGARSIRVELATTGRVRDARVLGYSIVDDVALLQVEDVAGLRPAALGDSSSVRIGDEVVALGNAGGRGGRPSVSPGTVTALERRITAADPDGGNRQSLDGLIELAVDIRSGDSGGPVADRTGTVVGMSAAASVRGGGLRIPSGGGEGYAIPIEDALAIAERIRSGSGGSDIHVGAERGVLGVQVQTTLGGGGGRLDRPARGAAVVEVEEGSGADRAGLTAGSVITAIGERAVASADDLVRALVPYNPGDSVQVTWTDERGSVRRGTVRLGAGPPA